MGIFEIRLKYPIDGYWILENLEISIYTYHMTKSDYRHIGEEIRVYTKCGFGSAFSFLFSTLDKIERLLQDSLLYYF